MATQADFDRIGNYALMYNKQPNIDRTKLSRVVPMQVLSLGYSRTGTLSMREALSILGYPNPYHFSSFYGNVKECDIWLDLIKRKFDGIGPPVTKQDFDGLLGHCGAVTDAPCHLFAKELIEFYPDAKVVLVERPLESWYKSWSKFLDNAFQPALYIFAALDPWFTGRIVGVGDATVETQVGGAKNLLAAKARSKEEYLKHYALVRSLVPEERILNFQLRDGWGPLCKFLGKDVPQEAFPHVNDTESNSKAFQELGMLGLKRIAWNGTKIASAIGMVGVVAWYQFRRMSR